MDRDRRPGREHRLDAGRLAVLCCRTERHDPAAALGIERPHRKVDGAAGPGNEPRADRFRTDLPGQIDLDRRVDRDHVVVLRDDSRVVALVGRIVQESLIIVKIRIRLAGPIREREHRLAGFERLAAVVDDAVLHQVDQRRAEHLCVDAQVPVILQRRDQRVRDAPDAKLQHIAVVDQSRDILADLALVLAERRIRQRVQRQVGVVAAFDLGEVPAQRAFHVRAGRVDLEDPLVRVEDHFVLGLHAGEHRHVAVFVRRSGDAHEDRRFMRIDHQLAHVAQVAGNVIAVAPRVGLAQLRSVEVTQEVETVCVLFVHDERIILRHDAAPERDIFHAVRDLVQVPVREHRFAGVLAAADDVAGLDAGERFLEGDVFFVVESCGFRGHKWLLSISVPLYYRVF